MAPRNSRRRGARKAKAKTKTTPPLPSTARTAEDHAYLAHISESNGDLQTAITHLTKATTLEPHNADLHEQLAQLHLQLCAPEAAEKALRVAISLQPNEGFEKFSYLSQLLGCTHEALCMARRGIDLMRGERAGLSAGMEARERELRAFEVRAQCSVAEICLGCIEESESIEVARRMDSEVERAVMEALALCGEGGQGEVEALVALANLRLSQGRRDEAKSAMGRVFSLMEGGLKLLEGEHVPDDRVVAALKALPGLEVRIAVGKQLVEVDMWMEGIVVLMSVMWECDFNVEVWYLLAVAYWKLGDFDEAKSALESTRQVLRNAQGYEGELEEHMIDKLYKELHVTNPLTPSMTD